MRIVCSRENADFSDNSRIPAVVFPRILILPDHSWGFLDFPQILGFARFSLDLGISQILGIPRFWEIPRDLGKSVRFLPKRFDYS